MRLSLAAALLCFVACKPAPAVPLLDAGPTLDATLDEPLLLTVAAARDRTQYLVDEGYTLTFADGVPAFTTDTSGTFGVALLVGGAVVPQASPRVAYATSDALVLRTTAGSLDVEHRFAAASSRVAVDELRLENRGKSAASVDVLAWVRRCTQPFLAAADFPGGVGLRHEDLPDVLWQAVGPGTFADHLRDAVVVEGAGATNWGGLDACGAGTGDDLAAVASAGASAAPAVVAVRARVTLAPGASQVVRAYRAVANQRGADTRADDLAAARALDLQALVREGQARLAGLPPADGLTRSQQLVWRSSFTLLDQLVMPAEGKLAQPYFLFSREPAWWFSKLGQHVHEGFALIALARLDPALAKGPLRNFFTRIEADGYLPYNLGPVVEQTAARTATAPLLAWVSWQVGRRDGDPAFLAEAYAAGSKLHEFWVTQRDKDQDGLCEWGGLPVTESLRDLENVIWTEVTSPDQVEPVDLNSMLVMEERSLASMARALGKPAEADAWDERARVRATLINAALWDEVKGFYFPRTWDRHGFTVSAPDDLKRLEISGFLPLWADVVPADRKARLLAHLTDAEFWRAGGVPGLAADDPYYDPGATRCCRWRGRCGCSGGTCSSRGCCARVRRTRRARWWTAPRRASPRSSRGTTSSGSCTTRMTRRRRTTRCRTTSGRRWCR